jgi:hypothetical protein
MIRGLTGFTAASAKRTPKRTLRDFLLCGSLHVTPVTAPGLQP